MNDSARPKKSRGLLALSPLAVFLCLYLGTSLAAGDFYKVPIAVAFLAASVYSVLISRGEPLAERIRHFTQGASHHNLMLMIWIFVLAGAFARSAQAKGGIAQRTGLETPMIVAVIVGGSFFGDNLSFISDTTIAATRTQECSMRDKFRVNGLIAVPAAAAVLGLYLLSGAEMPAAAQRQSVEWIPIIPYLAVLVLAVCGVHVTTVLVTGIVLTGAVGLLGGSVGWIEWIGALGEGIAGMGELIVITLLAGGMLEMIRRGGGIDYLIGALTRKVSGKRTAELSIAALVSMANLCTANNTIAIITTGPIARQIADRFGVDRRKSASLLDSFSCFVQGLIPYGAQLMIAAGLASVSPLEIIGYLYYPMALGICSLLAILLRYPRKYS